MRYSALILAITFAPTSLLASRPASPTYQATDASLATNFTVDAKTAIPGATLPSGQYTISVIEHLADRVILQVSDKKGKVQSTFLGLTSNSLTGSGSGPISWNNKGTAALRGFTFPGAPPVEFVYPKTQAVTIAKGTPDKVLAIDPASDNLSVTHDKLSTQDMQIVTLWTLKSTRVGPDAQPAIEAARYQVAAPVAPSAPASSVALATPPAPVHQTLPLRAVATKPAPAAQAKVEPAPLRKPSIAVLPHTASNLPGVLLAAVLALLGAAGLRLRRLYSNEV